MKACLVATLLFAASGLVSAQEANQAWEEYGKRVTASTKVSALGPDLFGDQVSLSNGALSFSVTDVSVPGNDALPVEFTRTFSVKGRKGSYVNADHPLADWEIDLPNISGVFAPDWVSGVSGTPGKRCSVTTVGAARPPVVLVGTTHFQPKDYWQGHNLSLPTGGGEMLLLDPARPRPTAGGPFYWITADQTRLACLPSIKNWSGGGEGFLAVAPDGTRYWFDWMAQHLEPVLEASTTIEVLGVPKTTTQRHARRRNVLYPSRVEDRFGNSVVYTYSNAWNSPVRPTSIQSSDGRRIDIHYNGNGHVASVVANGRTWAYQYSAANTVDKTLSAVVLPDATRWNIQFSGLLNSSIEYTRGVPGEPWRSCTMQPDLVSAGSFSGIVTHPSGAAGEFIVKPQLHGRTNVPLNCDNFTVPHNYGNDDISFWTISYHGLSLATKTISGPGLDTRKWTYVYSSVPSWYKPGGENSYPVCPANMDCSIPRCTSDDCAGASQTTVTEPDGTWTRYRHGNSYRYNEGKLLKIEEGHGSTVSRTTWNTYDLTQLDHEYPAKWGTSPRMIGDGFTSEFHRPLYQRSIVQDGASFNYQVYGFDHFARPVGVTRERGPASGASPSPPAGVPSLVAPATSTSGDFTVSWSKVAAAGYRLERRYDSGSWATLYSGGLSAHTLTSAPDGSHEFRVTACNADSCGGYSPVVGTLVTRPPGGAPVLTAPASSNTGTFNLAWTAVARATSYRLQQRKDAGSWSEIHNGAAMVKSVSGLGDGRYEHRVRACNAGGCSSFSTVKATEVALPPGSSPAISAPVSSNTAAFTVSWSVVVEATSYRLDQQKDGGSWSQVHNGSAASVAVAGLANGSYAHRVRACNAAGCSGYSSVVTTIVTVPPASAPVVTTPASSSTGAFSVGWTSVATATNYRLEQRKDAGPWSQIHSGTAVSKSVTGLSSGSYDYRARACNAGGCGAYSAVQTTVVTLPPGSAPTVSAPVSSNTGSFTVGWSAVVTTTNYRLEQSKDGGSWTQIYSSTGTSKAVSGLGSGSYRFRARACNAGGCTGYSGERTTIVTLPPASAPAVSTPASSSTGAFAVSWTSVAAATNYRLEQRKDADAWSQIHSGTAVSKSVTGLSSGSYAYRARACNVGGCGAYSAVQTTVVTLPPGSAPTVSAPASSKTGSFTVGWSAVVAATNYRLEQSKDSGTWSQIYSSTGTTKVVSGLGNGSYRFRARACNAGGCSGYSAIVATVVLLPPSSAPSVTTPAASSNGAYTVSWTNVASASNYRLEQQVGGGAWSQIYSGSGQSKAVSGLGNGIYGYRARACNAAGCSGYSATRVTTVTWPPSTAPALNVPTTAPANTVYTVRWNLVDTATRYELQLSALGGAWTSIYSGSLQYHTQNHRLDGNYAYRVRACNAGGCTPYSPTRTVVLYPSGGTCTGGFCPDPFSTGPGEPLMQPLMEEEGN